MVRQGETEYPLCIVLLQATSYQCLQTLIPCTILLLFGIPFLTVYIEPLKLLPLGRLLVIINFFIDFILSCIVP